MLRFILIGISLALIAAATSIPTSTDEDENKSLLTILSSSEDQLKNTFFSWGNIEQNNDEINVNGRQKDLFASTTLSAVPSVHFEKVFRYTMGKRVRNDRVVANVKGRKQWKEAQDVVMFLKYPTKGSGSVVTYVDIAVNQSSINGMAQVLSGGINQRSIGVLVEAKSTTWFEYSAQIYGI